MRRPIFTLNDEVRWNVRHVCMPSKARAQADVHIVNKKEMKSHYWRKWRMNKWLK